MSRSGYSYDCDRWELIRWRGAVASAIRGARGQAFLRELASAMDAMPDKRLGRGEIFDEDNGCVCALGVVAQARGNDLDHDFDREESERWFGIAEALAAEIMHENDDGGPPLLHDETPEKRWLRVREWVGAQI